MIGRARSIPLGGVGTASATVTVHNIAPAVEPLVFRQGASVVGSDVAVVLTGTPVNLQTSLSDVGARDSFNSTLYWGDLSSILVSRPTPGPISATHTYSRTGDFEVKLEVTDDDLSRTTVTRTLAVVDAAGAAANGITRLTAYASSPATPPAALPFLTAAIVNLQGDAADPTAGALDKLRKGLWNAALVKLGAAAGQLVQADTRMDADLSPLVTQLVYSARSVIVQLLDAARARVSTDADRRKLAAAEALFAEGDRAVDPVAAIDDYRRAVVTLPN